MLRRFAAVVLAGCGSPHSSAVPAAGSSVVPPAGSAQPGLISDDECRARGGEIVTEQTYAYLRRRGAPGAAVTPFRVCRVPSPNNDATCRGDADCAGGRCFCTGALARPDPQDDPALRALDSAAATGRCSDRPLPDGAWFCLVEAGTVHLAGIIVD